MTRIAHIWRQENQVAEAGKASGPREIGKGTESKKCRNESRRRLAGQCKTWRMELLNYLTETKSILEETGRASAGVAARLGDHGNVATTRA